MLLACKFCLETRDQWQDDLRDLSTFLMLQDIWVLRPAWGGGGGGGGGVVGEKVVWAAQVGSAEVIADMGSKKTEKRKKKIKEGNFKGVMGEGCEYSLWEEGGGGGGGSSFDKAEMPLRTLSPSTRIIAGLGGQGAVGRGFSEVADGVCEGAPAAALADGLLGWRACQP